MSLLLLLLSTGLLIETCFVSWPANEELESNLAKAMTELNLAREADSLPSQKKMALLTLRQDALIEVEADFGIIEPPSKEVTLQSVLAEGGYKPGDSVVIALEGLRDALERRLGSSRREIVAAFIVDLAQEMKDADLFTCLSLDLVPEAEAERPDDRGGIVAFTLDHSFVAGVADAVQFLERWILDPPAGLFINPITIQLQRIGPDLWGTSSRFYSGPPVRTDLAVSVLINVSRR